MERVKTNRLGPFMVMVLAMFFIWAPTVSASSFNTLDEPPYVVSGISDLGTIVCEVNAGALVADAVLMIKLPADFIIPAATISTSPSGFSGAELVIMPYYNGGDNALYPLFISDDIAFDLISENELRLSLYAEPDFSNKAYFLLYFNKIKVPSGVSGEIMASFSSNVGWGDGSVALAQPVFEPGKLEVTTQQAASFSDTVKVQLFLSEEKAGTFIYGSKLTLRLPEGFKWDTVDSKQAVSVQKGNIVGLNVERSGSDQNLVISVGSGNRNGSIVEGTSTVASEFTVEAGIVADLDKAKAGDVSAAISSSGGVQLAKNNDLKIAVFSPVVKELPSDSQTVSPQKAVFTINNAAYLINGQARMMDVAPYIKDSRTFMPVRYVAYALDINDGNITWNEEDQTVTLVKGDIAVQMKVGSTQLTVNGSITIMDVAPEITNSRTMLPASWVAQAFGATVEWEAVTQTVTITK